MENAVLETAKRNLEKAYSITQGKSHEVSWAFWLAEMLSNEIFSANLDTLQGMGYRYEFVDLGASSVFLSKGDTLVSIGAEGNVMVELTDLSQLAKITV